MSEESGNELYQHWVDQAFSSLMAAMATERLPKVSEMERKKHYKCAKEADDVQTHAKCVSSLLEANAEQAKQIRWMKLLGKKRLRSRVLRRKSESRSKKTKLKRRRKLKRKQGIMKTKKSEWTGGFRVVRRKREAISRSNYNLIDKDSRTLFGRIARQLTKTVRTFKNQKEHKSWQTVVADIKQYADGEHEKRELEENVKKRLAFYKKAAAKFEGGVLSKSKGRRRLSRLHELEKVLKYERHDEMEDLKKEFNRREKAGDPAHKAMAAPIHLVREGAKLAMMLAGKNTSDFNEKSIRLISPRIMSLVPDSTKGNTSEVNVFSPSLFALHDQGEGLEKTLSLPNLLGSTGLMDHRDQQDWMDFVVETSGAADVIEKTKTKREKEAAKNNVRKVRGPDGQPIYFTKENVTKLYGAFEASKIEVFEQLQKTFTPEQVDAMNRTGYAVLAPAQCELFYGPKSPYHNPTILKAAANVTDVDVHRAVRTTVRGVADGRLEYRTRRGVAKLEMKPQPRHKRAIILSPISGLIVFNDSATASQVVVLSPITFSALVASPAVFGVVVLSPWLFLPVVLSPRVLSPIILSPFAFVPVILTPLALVPIILSPGVMNPFVLSPFVLSPFILSPQALTPLILSPFALSPFIGTPNVLSPLVLSPFVLSPLIFSPAYVSALVLSPYALSPAFMSTPEIFTAIASPSWLSR